MQNRGCADEERTSQHDPDDRYDEEVDKLIEWLRYAPHLPNVTGTFFFSFLDDL